MTPDKWSNFSSSLELEADSIKASAISHIDNHLSATEQKREILPKSISSLSNYIKSLNSLRNLLRSSKFPSNFDSLSSNYRNELRKLLLAKYDSLYKSYDNERIKKFVQARCENYKDNQENNTSHLITTPKKIKEKVNEHFQRCPGSVSGDKNIPPEWAAFYQPLSTVDDNIYQDLMAPPSDQDWLAIITALPKDKAV
ncbi:hypothetical protein C1645_837650, partial [Glomus cerebriforme]